MLWTPNPKTVDAIKLCDRCGGIDRRHYANDHRDMRRYMSFHRACCCGGCEDIDFEVTFSGVDSGLCTACRYNPSTNQGHSPTAVSIDGTYSGGFTRFGTLPSFSMVLSGVGSWSVKYYAPASGSTTCSSSFVTRNGSFDITISGTCTVVGGGLSISISGVGALAQSPDLYSSFNFSGSASLGDTLSNQQTCPTPFGWTHLSNTGTAVVVAA